MKTLINGAATDQLAVSDRAVHYGDGLFETIAICNGRLEFWQRHMQRLQGGCKRLGLPLPGSALLLSEVRQLMAKEAGIEAGVLKIILSRGAGGRGYRPAAAQACQPTRILACYPWPDYPVSHSRQGVVLRYCSTPTTLNPALAGMKHLNRLEQVLARAEWDDPAIAEGVMFDINGHVVEGSMSNLFFVRDGVLHTPDLSNSGVAGIIREVVLALADSMNIPVQCQHYTRHDLECADEVFVTNSIIGLWPVQQIEQRCYTVGTVTQKLLDAFNGKRTEKGEYEII